MTKMTFGVIVGNRGFFPDQLAGEGRTAMLEVLKKAGYDTVVLSTNDTKCGAVETYADAKKCAALFAGQSDKIDGLIVTLPNFGDEKGVAESIKRAGLDVPVLIHAEPDTPSKMTLAHRRDSFCGKLSVCNNLRQANIPYTLTKSHTVKMASAQFKKELADFASVCRIVKGLRNARFGAIGARCGAFNTVRYSEKLLEDAGIAVETVDLSEIFGRANLLSDKDKAVAAKVASVKKYISHDCATPEIMLRIAKFGVVVDRFIEENDLDGTAIQCWTSIQEYYGITPCTIMSMMSESLKPSACEVDITGLLGMYILQLASDSPSALLDWNNNYGESEDKCVLFHCSNLPKSFFDKPVMGHQEIVGNAVGMDKACGTVLGRIKAGPATFLRCSTDDVEGVITCYLGEGKFTNDKLNSFGGYGVIEIPRLQALMNYICQMGFEHHVAVNLSQQADAIGEALENYLGWELYQHHTL